MGASLAEPSSGLIYTKVESKISMRYYGQESSITEKEESLLERAREDENPEHEEKAKQS